MAIPMYNSVVKGINVVKLKSPVAAQMELTKRCQYNCFFCYNYWKANMATKKLLSDMSKEDAILASQKLIEAEIFSVILSGGEPTLVDYLPEIVSLFSKANIDTTIITNGSCLTPTYLEELSNAGLDSMQISMHHFIEEKMNRITGNQKSYTMTLSGIKNAIKYFKADNFNVNMVVTRDTVSDVKEMGVFLTGLGVKYFSVGIVSYCGEATINNLVCDKEDLRKVYLQLQDLSSIIGVGITGGMPYCVLPDEDPEKPVQIANSCDAAISQIVVSPNGDLRPCVELPMVVGNILRDNLFSVWQDSPGLIRIREFRNAPTTCHPCELLSYCHGGCRASALSFTGSETGKDPLMEV